MSAEGAERGLFFRILVFIEAKHHGKSPTEYNGMCLYQLVFPCQESNWGEATGNLEKSVRVDTPVC